MSGRVKLPNLEKLELVVREHVQGLDNRRLHLLLSECELASEDNCSVFVFLLRDAIQFVAQFEVHGRDGRRSSPPLPLFFDGKAER